MAADEPPPPVEKMVDDWAGDPIGTLAETRSKIGFVLPDVDFGPIRRWVFMKTKMARMNSKLATTSHAPISLFMCVATNRHWLDWCHWPKNGVGI